MKKQAIFALLVTIFTLSLAGCATIMSGSTQRVNVQAIDAKTHKVIPNARCVFRDRRNVAFPIEGNPGSVVLDRQFGSLRTECHAKGYVQKKVVSGNSFNAWTLGNVIFWPGAIVDAATGAAMRYPSHITVLMHKK